MRQNINNLMIWRMLLNLNVKQNKMRRKNIKNEMYSDKHQIILVMLCNKITLFYILFLYYNKITFNSQ